MARGVLDYAPMRLAFGAVILASMTSVASAGTYIGLGVGSESTGGAEYSDGRGSVGGGMDGFERSGRLMVGKRMSKLSVEGQASRFDVNFDYNGYEATQLALALKLSLPLGSGFEFFGKGGLERTWLSGGPSEMHGAAGNGLLLGAGFEYQFSLGLTGASIFVDYQRASTSFENEYMVAWDGVTSMWTLGATVSL